MIEDKLLIYRFKQDHNGALRQIYDKYKVDLLKLAIVLVGDAGKAEDIVHDVFVKFAQSADRISITGSLRNYLITSVINRVRNVYRDSKRRPETSLEATDSLSSGSRNPHQWAVLSERLELLSNALGRLPYEQREVIRLRMEINMKFRQIAAVQTVSINTVKGRYRAAIEKLRFAFDSEVEK
jgi:RNA polymerase sigma factor (sigma-70 family)